jgi:hypothetical protein
MLSIDLSCKIGATSSTVLSMREFLSVLWLVRVYENIVVEFSTCSVTVLNVL